MCGICGYTGRNAPETLKNMMSSIYHRGPDDSGQWQNQSVAIGMRRLSIIDINEGQQPIHNENKSIWLVFNGEIYNHIELRTKLESLGHQFYTDHSDTEVLVHLYEEYGADYLQHLNGMFAIALWNEHTQELHLARDRAGIKPLFYSIQNGQLIFGSEIKAVLKHPNVSKEPDLQALGHYFSFKNIPAPQTAFQGISQLLPGERAVFSKGQFKVYRWWKLDFSTIIDVSEEEALSTIREILENSVRIRMRSDAPFGAYLSGGIDSSSVVALMAQLSDQPIKTFSMVYEKDYMNKSADKTFARKVSKQYGTDHYEYVMTQQDLMASMDEVLTTFDEPFSGVTSTYFLTKLISKHVKVALSGDGADELFGSYLSHRLATPLANYSRLKDKIERLTEKEKQSLAPFESNLEQLQGFYKKGDEVDRRMGLYLFDDREKRNRLFSDKMINEIGDTQTRRLIEAKYEQSQTLDPLNRALFVDFETLLPDQVLAFVDRLSMAHSVEVRTPFLDYRLMEYVASLPGSLKIKNGRVKHILKEAIKDLLPQNLIDRPKEGFVLPVNNWLSEDMGKLVRKVLQEDRLKKHGLLNQNQVNSYLRKQFIDNEPFAPQLWNMVNFQLWWECYFN
jgi:asparagine synthase (glutamine-hydrolysing)